MLPNPWLLLGGFVVAFSAGFYSSTQWHDGDVAEFRNEVDRVAIAGYKRAADITAQNQARADAARKDLDALRERNRKTALALAALSSGVQQFAGEYAAGSADDTLAACHARAGRLADLLGAGAGLVAEGAGRVEGRTGEAMTLYNAWPH